MEFARHEVVDFIKTRLLTDENFKIPGFQIPPKAAPDVEIEVQTPTFGVLGWHGQNIAIKDSDRDKYKDNDAFQARFNALEAALHQAVERHSIEPVGKGIKREATGCEDGQPSPKKLKECEQDNMAQSEPQELTDPESIKTKCLHGVTLAQRWTCGQTKQIKVAELILKICANHQLCIVNSQASDVEMAQGSIVAGFGKCKWATDCEGDAKHEMRYTLQSSADSVIFNANLTTLGALLNQKRLTDEADNARCCYHELIEDPKNDDNSAFYLRSTQDISYVLSDVPVKAKANGKSGSATKAIATQATAGSLIPPEQWNTKFTAVHWIVKWLPKKGLQPVRPRVTWVAPSTRIPAGKALRLTMDPSDQ